MSNTKDLTDQRFGRLIVINRTDDKKGNCYLWLCRCECGKEVLVRTYFLTHSITRSCGCLQDESRKYDLANQRFGRLVAKSPTDKKVHNCIIWLCQCDCGKIAYVRSDHLVQKITRSCGCLHDETALKNGKDRHLVNLKDGTNVALIKSDKLPINNTSGCKGVSWHKSVGMWQARICFKKVNYHLGYFADIDKAVEARKDAELKYFGEYLNTKES